MSEAEHSQVRSYLESLEEETKLLHTVVWDLRNMLSPITREFAEMAEKEGTPASVSLAEVIRKRMAEVVEARKMLQATMQHLEL